MGWIVRISLIGLTAIALAIAVGRGNIGERPTVEVASAISVNVNSRQGFDTCSRPSTNQMQTWWNSSPYYWIGLYFGESMLLAPRLQITHISQQL